MNDKDLKPSIILASYPRSGNTFLRNVLYEVYGIYSWNNIEVYNKNLSRLNDLNARLKDKKKLSDHAYTKLAELNARFNYQVLKSHELPAKIKKNCTKDAKVIYLVRDGRDALVSMAHHRKDIVEPGTDFLANLEMAIRAPLGTYFGGWSRNVKKWTKIADTVIRFEDLIQDPLKYTESFNSFMEMPKADKDRIPTFESQKFGVAHFGGNARKGYTEEEKNNFNDKFFRKGKVGTWKDEMPDSLQKLFWKKNGDMMEKMGYSRDGQIIEMQ